MSIVLGVDSSNVIHPLLVDATGKPLVVLGAGNNNIGDVDVISMPVTQVKSSNNNHIFSYETQVVKDIVNSNLSTGTNFLVGDTIPANKIAVINVISYRYVGTVTGVTLLAVFNHGSVNVNLDRTSPPVSAVYYIKTGEFLLMAGDSVRLVITGATAGDDAQLTYAGYLMDVT